MGGGGTHPESVCQYQDGAIKSVPSLEHILSQTTLFSTSLQPCTAAYKIVSKGGTLHPSMGVYRPMGDPPPPPPCRCCIRGIRKKNVDKLYAIGLSFKEKCSLSTTTCRYIPCQYQETRFNLYWHSNIIIWGNHT